MNSVRSTNSDLSLNHSKKTKSIDDQLIPLINIVFLLLIFFLVSGRIEQQSAHKVEPPTINNQTASQRLDKHLLITADGAVFLRDKQVEVEQLSGVIQQHFSEENEILIKADRNITAKRLSKLILALKAHSSAKIRFVIIQEAR